MSDWMLGPEGEHIHKWGEIELARFTGEPHRKCTVVGCRFITIDFDEGDEDE